MHGQWVGWDTGGPCHLHVTMRPRGNADVTMPRGSIKGSSVPCLLPELAWRQPEDIGEEVLEEPVESLDRG